jgi:hypothetical protein
VCTLAVKKKSGQVSTCRIGPFPCQLPSHCLKMGLAGPKREHLALPFIFHCNDIVACPLHSSVWLTVACISTAAYIRHHGYEIRNQLLRSSVYNRLPIRCLGMNAPSICHTASFLKVVRPEQPNSPSFFCGVFRIPVYLFLRDNLQSIATSAPSLKPARPERLPDKVPISPNS